MVEFLMTNTLSKEYSIFKDHTTNNNYVTSSNIPLKVTMAKYFHFLHSLEISLEKNIHENAKIHFFYILNTYKHI